MQPETDTQTDGEKLDPRIDVLRNELVRVQDERDKVISDLERTQKDLLIMMQSDVADHTLMYLIGLATGIALAGVVVNLVLKYAPKASV